MTDTERREVNERIAEAMGLERRVSHNWRVDGCYHPEPPDFYTDPVAADALMRWVARKNDGTPRRVGIELDIMGDGSWRVMVGTNVKNRAQNHDWKVALALAADAAIKEASK